MKKVFKILKKIAFGILYLIGFIFITLLCAVLFSKKDYGTPDSLIGEQIQSIAIKNVNVISMDKNKDTIQSNMTVLIDKGIISQVIPDSIQIPNNYKIKEGNGRYLIPGLIDMHAHIFDRSDLPMYLSYGVTTVRNMMGFPMHLRWKKQVLDNKYQGARLITSSPTINSGEGGDPFHKNISSAREAIEAIKEYKANGYDFIKIYDGITKDQYLAIMQEAANQDMYVAGHPPHTISLDTLIKHNLNSIEHIEEIIQGPLKYKLDTVKGREIAKKLKAKNMRVTATLSAYYAIYRTTINGQEYIDNRPQELINPFVRFIGKKQLSEWVDPSEGYYKWNTKKYECMASLVKIFHEEGVELLLGTDTGPNLTVPGLTVHEEILLLKGLGLSPLSILQSGTMKAANALGMANEIGSITVGKKAEFVLLNENPLKNLSTLMKPQSIVSNGIWYDDNAIMALKNLGKDKSNTFMTLGRFIDHAINK